MAAPNKRKPTPQRKAEQNNLTPVLERVAGHKVMRLLGYWMLVQTYGGWQGVAAQPFWPEGSVQRYRLEFREAFGCEAEDYVPEVAPVLRAALYGGPEDTWDSAAGVAAQDQARTDLAARKAAKKKPAKKVAEPTLHEALGTVKA